MVSIWIAIISAISLWVAGGARISFRGSPQTSANLTIFAAASLTDAFKVLGAEFERTHPGSHVQFNFAGSQQLALQIEQGAAADVFASADQRWMSYAREHGLIEGEPAVFTHNRLVVIVPRTNPGRIRKLEDLARRGLKLVVAAEAVPVGRYSREMLGNLGKAPGFPENFDNRVLANVVSQEDNVKAVVAKVQLGEADAGIAYRSDVTAAVRRYVEEIAVPDKYNVLASYPIAIVKGAKDPSGARAFATLVRSAEGQRVLTQHGFVTTGATAPEPANVAP